MQLNLEKRFASGSTLQSNYTFSRTIGEDEGDTQDLHSDYRDARNRHLDKRLLAFNIVHVLRNSGMFELPVGPGRRLLGKSNGLTGRLVERWQVGAIVNVFSGQPLGLTTDTTAFNALSDTARLVGNLPKSTGSDPYE